MTDITPIRSTEDHIQAEYCDASCIVILVEDPLKFLVQQGRTLLETNAPRRVKTATLAETTSVVFDHIDASIRLWVLNLPGIH